MLPHTSDRRTLSQQKLAQLAENQINRPPPLPHAYLPNIISATLLSLLPHPGPHLWRKPSTPNRNQVRILIPRGQISIPNPRDQVNFLNQALTSYHTISQPSIWNPENPWPDHRWNTYIAKHIHSQNFSLKPGQQTPFGTVSIQAIRSPAFNIGRDALFSHSWQHPEDQRGNRI